MAVRIFPLRSKGQKRDLSGTTKSHTAAFPLSLCSPDCLREQLDAYYQNMIKCSDDAKLKFKNIGKDSKDVEY